MPLQKKDAHVTIRLSEDEKLLADRAARSLGLHRSEWVRDVLTRAAVQQLAAGSTGTEADNA